ncbi:UNVERIFIED_CONTAM: hypothetical protein Sradi_7103300 [Sesamum radiatum]|uniref:Uncharacterized protein n=1 Tax=Sesamum radiatum TaxID=300843 RepID=A0AAW2J1E1_SESRA
MHQLALSVGTQSLRRDRIMETPTNAPNKQKAREAPVATTQVLQVVPSTSLTPLSGTVTTTMLKSTNQTVDTPRIIVSPDPPMWSYTRIS